MGFWRQYSPWFFRKPLSHLQRFFGYISSNLNYSEDSEGCTDTAFKQVQITDDYWMYIPNSFTPDLDGINDKFCIAYNGVREATLTFNVYTRFSELVYSTNNIHDLDCENGWDGKHPISGNDLPLGAYIYKIYYQDFEGWKHQETDKIIIIR